jgi:Tol biopolymer transport system component
MIDAIAMMRSFVLLLTVAAATLSAQDAKHFSNVRQLTNGGQNAEAYWSPDGKRLIFQSTRDEYKCDQIFTMNADGSDVRLVSTGKGQTTCGYFLKDGKHILYASTHEGSPECPPPPDRSKGYVWGVFPTFDIYVADDTGKNLNKITDARGYDAEATVNFKTGKVIYTSLASGDLDLWVMNSDGSGKRQITKKAGYDGGAVFSRDGKKIVWRAKYPEGDDLVTYKDFLSKDLVSPMEIEIMLADADGSNQRQLTNFGCASFAPTFTPDGKKILFASNKHNCGSREFELFLINLDGTGLEQVTNFGGFTSFPEFSPDGMKLVFASSLNAKSRREFNIFVVDWK